MTQTYDNDGRLALVTAGGQTTTHGYDLDSEPTSATLPTGNGYKETASYDPAGRMTAISDTKGASTLSSFVYTYDAAGNPTKVTTPSMTTAYGYDQNERLTSACYGSSCTGGSIAYTYDGDGNRTKLTDSSGATTYSYDGADELTSANGPAGTTSYSYDKDGRRASGGPSSYTWNAADELTSLTTGWTNSGYSYDGDGNRASTTSGGQTTTFLYDINNRAPLLALEQRAGSTVRRYLWGSGLISMNSGGRDYYPAHDAQGSVVALTSANGTTQATYSYDPFGDQLTANIISGAPSIPLRFEAQYLDASGLYHLSARQLDPTIGAFITTDPLTPDPSKPAISPYLYVNDQPTVLQDPTGESSQGGDSSAYYNNLINQQYAKGELRGHLEYGIGVAYGGHDSLGQAERDQAINSAPEVAAAVASELL